MRSSAVPTSPPGADAEAPHPTPRQATLLDQLEEIFVQEGFRRVRIGELAARLHCSRRTLYALAPSKEALFLQVLDRLLQRIDHLGREAVAREPVPRQRVAALIAPGFTELRRANRAFFADVQSLPAAKRRLDTHQASRSDQVRELIAAGIRAGDLRKTDPVVAAEVMLAGYRAVVNPEFLSRVNVSSSAAVRIAQDLLLHGLMHPAGLEPGPRSASRP